MLKKFFDMVKNFKGKFIMNINVKLFDSFSFSLPLFSRINNNFFVAAAEDATKIARELNLGNPDLKKPLNQLNNQPLTNNEVQSEP